MTRRKIKIFINEIHCKAPKKNYATNETDFYHIHDASSLDLSDINDYCPENNRGYDFSCD